MTINGIHHITALASDPQTNIDFYVDVLGLRLVKRTVNFDAPDVYHLYYGDETGQPGTILTFFPFPRAARGKRGIGEISAVTFSVPGGATEFWAERLSRRGIHIHGPFKRFDDTLIAFQDPDGMTVEILFSNEQWESRYWNGNPVSAEFAIRRLQGVTLQLGRRDETDRVLQKMLNFRFTGQDGNRYRYLVGTADSQAAVDLLVDPSLPHVRQSAGSVHHIAWSVADAASQRAWRKTIIESGFQATEILDRRYFQSIYFREPGGVLFEIATDPPGFTVDETVEDLGTQLQLPPWLESEREKLERVLPPIQLKKKQEMP